MDINKMMQKNQIIKNKFKKTRVEFDKEEFIFNNLITISIIGNLEMQKKYINSSVLEMLNSVITAKINRVIRNITNKKNLLQKQIIGSSNISAIKGLF